MERIRGRVFPLKGKTYKGAWEFEVAGELSQSYCSYTDRFARGSDGPIGAMSEAIGAMHRRLYLKL